MTSPTARIILCALLLWGWQARAADLVVLVDTGTEMPMARFEKFHLVDGIHKDIGSELARRLQRRPVFVTLPRKRIALALAEGQGDILCAYVPEWLEGQYHWSTPFIPVTELLVTERSAPRPMSLADVAGKKVGTVLGYRHPELEQALGEQFAREDASNMETNLRKLAAGRIQHALAVKWALDYRLKMGDPPLKLHPPLVVKTYMTQCAVSPRGKVLLADVNRAIAQMIHEGTVAAILDRYQ